MYRGEVGCKGGIKELGLGFREGEGPSQGSEYSVEA